MTLRGGGEGGNVIMTLIFPQQQQMEKLITFPNLHVHVFIIITESQSQCIAGHRIYSPSLRLGTVATVEHPNKEHFGSGASVLYSMVVL